MGWLSDKTRRLKRQVKKIGDNIGDALESARDHLRDDVLHVVSLIPSPIQPAAQAYMSYYQSELAADARKDAERQYAYDLSQVQNAQVYTLPAEVSDAYIASRNLALQTNTAGYKALGTTGGAYGVSEGGGAAAGIGGATPILVGAGVLLIFTLLAFLI
jgi:hypothetical protein